MILYLILAYLFRAIAGGRDGESSYLTKVFDGVTAATSVSLLWGIMDPVVMVAIGETKLFLMIAGIAGLGYSTKALFSPFRSRRTTL